MFSARSLVLSGVWMYLAVLNSLSDAVEAAGGLKYFLAKLAKIGHFEALPRQKSKGSDLYGSVLVWVRFRCYQSFGV